MIAINLTGTPEEASEAITALETALRIHGYVAQSAMYSTSLVRVQITATVPPSQPEDGDSTTEEGNQ